MKTTEYCAALKRRWKISSDYELAKRLGVSKQAISNYVNGQRAFDVTTAARVAEILELEPLRVIADMELERGSSPELWKRLRDAAAIAGVMVAGALLYQVLAGGFDINGFASALALAVPLQASSVAEYALCVVAAATVLTLLAELALGRPRARAPLQSLTI